MESNVVWSRCLLFGAHRNLRWDRHDLLLPVVSKRWTAFFGSDDFGRGSGVDGHRWNRLLQRATVTNETPGHCACAGRTVPVAFANGELSRFVPGGRTCSVSEIQGSRSVRTQAG